MHEDLKNFRVVKREPLKSTEQERAEFDKMFWADVDPDYAPGSEEQSEDEHSEKTLSHNEKLAALIEARKKQYAD